MDSIQLNKLLGNPSENDFFILDIDSTLVTTHQRNQAIIDAFIEQNESQFPDETNQLKKAQCQLGDYGIETSLKRINFQSPNENFMETLMGYWRENFFANHFLTSDCPTQDAVQWVQKLRQANIPFVYLTARHKATMWEGTLSSLQALGFPIDESILFLKDDLSLKDDEYKSRLMQKLIDENQGKKLWLIDNEPVVLNKMLADHPEVGLIWFDSCHSGRMDPPDNVLTIKHFSY